MADPSEQVRWRTVGVVIGMVVLVGAMAVLAIVGGPIYLRNEILDNELPSCDREHIILEWTQQEGLWSRSATFELLEDSQTVQVDVALARDDGGVIQVGKTVYAIAAGGDLPADFAETSPATQSFRGTVVGRGVDGVNEQVTLEAGKWQLIVKGGASAPEVRWPC